MTACNLSPKNWVALLPPQNRAVSINDLGMKDRSPRLRKRGIHHDEHALHPISRALALWNLRRLSRLSNTHLKKWPLSPLFISSCLLPSFLTSLLFIHPRPCYSVPHPHLADDERDKATFLRYIVLCALWIAHRQQHGFTALRGDSFGA